MHTSKAGSCIGNMKWEKFTPKQWRETDVEIKIECCGVCASDLHTARSGWGPTRYPCVVGYVFSNPSLPL